MAAVSCGDRRSRGVPTQADLSPPLAPLLSPFSLSTSTCFPQQTLPPLSPCVCVCVSMLLLLYNSCIAALELPRVESFASCVSRRPRVQCRLSLDNFRARWKLSRDRCLESTTGARPVCKCRPLEVVASASQGEVRAFASPLMSLRLVQGCRACLASSQGTFQRPLAPRLRPFASSSRLGEPDSPSISSSDRPPPSRPRPSPQLKDLQASAQKRLAEPAPMPRRSCVPSSVRSTLGRASRRTRSPLRCRRSSSNAS